MLCGELGHSTRVLIVSIQQKEERSTKRVRSSYGATGGSSETSAIGNSCVEEKEKQDGESMEAQPSSRYRILRKVSRCGGEACPSLGWRDWHVRILNLCLLHGCSHLYRLFRNMEQIYTSGGTAEGNPMAFISPPGIVFSRPLPPPPKNPTTNSNSANI